LPGGTCGVVVIDSSNPTVGVVVPVAFGQ
jgi:hypothetical protein